MSHIHSETKLTERNERGMGQRERFYYLPLTTQCIPGCPFCEDIGCKNLEARTLQDVERGFHRAKSAKIDTVLLPSGFLTSVLQNEIVELARLNFLNLIVQVPVVESVISDECMHSALTRLSEQGCEFNFLISNRDKFNKADAISKLTRQFPHSYLTLIAQKGLKLASVLGQLSLEFQNKTFLYFPMKQTLSDMNLSCAQINRELNQLRREMPEFPIRPPRGIEVWNGKINPRLGLEPIDHPTAVAASASPAIKVSVIIPTFNNRAYLLNTIGHLKRQNMHADEFEIVIVDDGSTDDTHHEIIDLIREANGNFNIKYIYFPRRARRSMGDGNFRAGIARNLGVKSSSGAILVFLDSDILTPVDFLDQTLKAHLSHDVVQCVRLNLKSSIACDTIQYHEIDQAVDTSAFEGDYWKTFFAAPTWESLPFHWKYTCTYGLSMSRETFEQVGWLRKSFVYYGFEDTELGYRLAKANFRFHLSPVVTYHCFHQSDRSEYRNLDFRRHQLLSKTARIFYHNILDPEVFDHFSFYLNDRAAWITFCLGAGARRLLKVRSQFGKVNEVANA